MLGVQIRAVPVELMANTLWALTETKGPVGEFLAIVRENGVGAPSLPPRMETVGCVTSSSPVTQPVMSGQTRPIGQRRTMDGLIGTCGAAASIAANRMIRPMATRRGAMTMPHASILLQMQAPHDQTPCPEIVQSRRQCQFAGITVHLTILGV